MKKWAPRFPWSRAELLVEVELPLLPPLLPLAFFFELLLLLLLVCGKGNTKHVTQYSRFTLQLVLLLCD